MDQPQQLDINVLIQALGAKELELTLLRQRVLELTKQITELKPEEK